MRIKEIVKKEVLQGLRSYKFLVMIIGFLFFAILDPVMSKFILPIVLEGEFPGMSREVMESMIPSTQVAIIRGYLGNVYQVGMIIIVFTLSGIIAQEISERTLILPVSSGKRYGDILIGKVIVYGSVLLFTAVFSIMVNYAYSGLLFEFDLESPLPVIRGGLLQGLYMLFVLSMLIFIGSLVKKPLMTGLLTLVVVYGSGALGGLLNINSYLPSGLIDESTLLAVVPSIMVLKSIISTIAIIILLIGFTIIRLSKMELTRG